jgi:hypothetical protein
MFLQPGGAPAELISVHPIFALTRLSKSLMEQGEVLDKGAYSHLLEFCLGSFKMGRCRRSPFRAANGKPRWLRCTLPRTSPCSKVATLWMAKV